MPLTASIAEHGDHIYITTPVSLYEPEEQEIETFAFARDIRSAAPNPNILWLKGQYVEADKANRNQDEWTAGELSIKALTPVLMPITVMHDLRSAVGTIADAGLRTPEKDGVPRARIDTMLAQWAHRFPEVAEECRVNAAQGTLMQSMECLSPYYDCSVCGKMMQRGPNWAKEWRTHVSEHADVVANSGRSPTRTLRNVTFTGVGLIFGTRGAKGAMPSAHLQVEELAAMHREAHSGTTAKRPRRKSTVEIEDSKYEALVAAKSEGDSAKSQVAELTAKLETAEKNAEEAEARAVKAEQERDAATAKAEEAEEGVRVAAMKEERLSALGTGFIAKLDKLETTAKRVREQAAKLTDEEWSARLDELEETLSVKRDATVESNGDEGDKNTSTAGLLFNREAVASSQVGATREVTASEAQEVSPERRRTVLAGLARKPKAKA